MAEPTPGLPPSLRPILFGSAIALMVAGAVLLLLGLSIPGMVLLATGAMEFPIAIFLTRER